MNKVEYLMVCLMEEAAEIQQITSKCLRFGLSNHHPEHPEVTNIAELHRELVDMDAIRFMLMRADVLPVRGFSIKAMSPKIEKVQRYMRVSEDCGTLKEADQDGTAVTIPCKRGDVCYEVDAGHGVITHTVTGYYAFDREIQYSDGKHIVKGIEIDTWAVDDHGGAWPDHYSGDEWERRICTRKEAEAALNAAPEQEAQP